ncbi:MAG TPA: hypothetical protein VFY13_09610, partial [Luteolibacter sp.]|nr:hypothetical protein [Luteolibacter sp.]
MLKNLIEKLGSRVVVNAFDPASLQDPVALLTEWKPAKGGGTNFRTHRLDRSNPQRLEFRCTIGMMLFAGAFFAVGIVALG